LKIGYKPECRQDVQGLGLGIGSEDIFVFNQSPDFQNAFQIEQAEQIGLPAQHATDNAGFGSTRSGPLKEEVPLPQGGTGNLSQATKKSARRAVKTFPAGFRHAGKYLPSSLIMLILLILSPKLFGAFSLKEGILHMKEGF
jgi:hypothetical protein